MRIIDKAAWQIDGGVPEDLVVNHFNTVFLWLSQHDMLTEEGIEELEDGIDDCASINDELVNEDGMRFLETSYDDYLKAVEKEKYGEDVGGTILETVYSSYLSNSNAQ